MANVNTRSEHRKRQFSHAVFKKLARIGVATEHVALEPSSGTFRSGRLGLYCGTGMDRSMVTHELSHIIQPTDKDFERLYLEFEGTVHFHVPGMFIGGTWCSEPETDKIGRRELDTFAVEYLLANKLGLNKLSLEAYIEKHVALLQYLPDWIMWKSAKKAELYLRARILDWQDVDLVARLNDRLSRIKQVANWLDTCNTFYVYDAKADSTSCIDPRNLVD